MAGTGSTFPFTPERRITGHSDARTEQNRHDTDIARPRVKDAQVPKIISTEITKVQTRIVRHKAYQHHNPPLGASIEWNDIIHSIKE
jgi:hypothetical protein